MTCVVDLLDIAAIVVLYHELHAYAFSGKLALSSPFFCAAPALPHKGLFKILALFFAVAVLLTNSATINSLFSLSFIPYTLVQSWRVSNHFLLCIFVCIGYLSLRGQLGSCGLEQSVTAFYAVIIVYFFATLHKCNRHFCIAETSCANRFLKSMLDKIGIILPRFVLTASPYLVLISESLVLVLLLCGIGKLALVICFAMHFLFGITGNPHFSMCMYGLLFFVFGGPSSISISWSFYELLTILVSLCLSLYLMPQGDRYEIKWATTMTYGIFGIVSGAFFVWLMHCSSIMSAGQLLSAPFTHLQPIFVCLVILFVLNCASPYFWKTEFSFAMFSNLRPDLSNHFFIRTRNNNLCNNFIRISAISSVEAARQHHNQTVRTVTALYDQHKKLMYNVDFLRESALLFLNNDIKTFLIDVTLPSGSKQTMDLCSPLSADTLKLLPQPVKWLNNRYPACLPLDVDLPYMG